MPPTIPINHYLSSRNQQNRTEVLSYYSMLMYSKRTLAWNTLISSRYMSQIPHHTVKCRYVLQEDVKAEPDAHPEGGPVILNRNPTTSFLTATTLIYAIGAGITAAAGTRLALQVILIKRFKVYSFQLQDMDALYCYFLSLPPCVRIG